MRSFQDRVGSRSQCAPIGADLPGSFTPLTVAWLGFASSTRTLQCARLAELHFRHAAGRGGAGSSRFESLERARLSGTAKSRKRPARALPTRQSASSFLGDRLGSSAHNRSAKGRIVLSCKHAPPDLAPSPWPFSTSGPTRHFGRGRVPFLGGTCNAYACQAFQLPPCEPQRHHSRGLSLPSVIPTRAPASVRSSSRSPIRSQPAT